MVMQMAMYVCLECCSSVCLRLLKHLRTDVRNSDLPKHIVNTNFTTAVLATVIASSNLHCAHKTLCNHTIMHPLKL
jgi:hypothetical protein